MEEMSVGVLGWAGDRSKPIPQKRGSSPRDDGGSLPASPTPWGSWQWETWDFPVKGRVSAREPATKGQGLPLR